jgi:hypothetical protein
VNSGSAQRPKEGHGHNGELPPEPREPPESDPEPPPEPEPDPDRESEPPEPAAGARLLGASTTDGAEYVGGDE